MKKVRCPKCGNDNKFTEWVLIHRYNHFVQQKDGKVIKGFVKEKQDDEYDSVITCEICNNKLSWDSYHQFLDNYTETPAGAVI
ncbi:MAG: hypothetical protein AB1599_02815 [Planctomycetota bacterium]